MDNVPSLYEIWKQILFDELPKLNSKNLKIITGSQWRKQILKGFPKKSKILSTNMFKDVFKIEDSRLCVIMMHLYAEVIASNILEKNLKDPKVIENYSFYHKIRILKAMGIFDVEISNDFLYLNEIRNRFAHKLSYDITKVDMSKFSDLKGVYSLINFKRKAEKRALNIFLLQNEIILLLIKLSEKFDVVNLLDME